MPNIQSQVQGLVTPWSLAHLLLTSGLFHLVCGCNLIWSTTQSCITCQQISIHPQPQIMSLLPASVHSHCWGISHLFVTICCPLRETSLIWSDYGTDFVGVKRSSDTIALHTSFFSTRHKQLSKTSAQLRVLPRICPIACTLYPWIIGRSGEEHKEALLKDHEKR